MEKWSMVYGRMLVVVLLAGASVACGSGAPEARRAADGGEDAGAPDAPLQDASDDGGSTDLDTDDADDEADAEVDGGGDADDPDAPDSPRPVDCAPLPESGGTIVEVDPSMVGQLPQLVRQAQAHTTFVLAAGTYAIDGTLHVRAEGVTLRSADDDAESVVIDGGYTVNSLLFINASDVTVAHLTLRRALHHPIHITPTGEASENLSGTRIYGVHIADGAQQFIKINPNGARSAFVDEGLVACSRFELTDAGRPHVDRSATGCYTGGVDAHAARGWVVRDNHFKDIYCAGEGLAEHAVHFWSASRDTVVERNLIENCARGVGFGLLQSGGDRAYPDDPYPEIEGYMGHIDGVIRNNIIVADIAYYDTGIELAQARGARVIHNTIFDAEAANRFSSIDYRFPNTSVEIRNNLVGRITRRNEASGQVDHNLEGIGAELFEDVASLDFHLRASATEAIDQGVVLEDAGLDIDGETRDKGAAPDLGADER